MSMLAKLRSGYESMTEYEEKLPVAKEEFEKHLNERKDIILKLAGALERDGHEKDDIAKKIAHDFADLASRAWIYKVLPDEYKQKEQQHEKPVYSVDRKELQETVLQAGGTATILETKSPDDENPSVSPEKRETPKPAFDQATLDEIIRLLHEKEMYVHSIGELVNIDKSAVAALKNLIIFGRVLKDGIVKLEIHGRSG